MDLALFDLDETLLCDDSASLWLRWLVSEGFAPPELHQQEQELMQKYYQGQLPMEEYMLATLAPLAGLSQTTVAAWVERFIRRDILPRIYPAARQQLAWHKQRGDYIIVVSATGEHLVTPIARQLGAHHALAIGVTVEDERFTGSTYGIMTYQQGKVQRLNEWLQKYSGEPFAETHAYSDSINDRALLEYVDRANVINPDSELRELALTNGWHIYNWQR